MGDPIRLTGGQVLSRVLKGEGVENIFTIAGDHILPILDVMSDTGFKFIDTRHEQSAVHMADVWSRITGQLGVVMYTTPGFANAIPGLINALNTEGPVISISGCAPLAELGRGAMQEIDQIGMARPVTKGAWIVTDPRRIPQMVSQAIRVAYSGRRGPVHITIPIDIQEQTVLESDIYFHYSVATSTQVHGDPGAVQKALLLLRKSKRPLIIAGTAASYNDSGDLLRRLVETLRIPVFTEGDARGLISDDHPHSLGFFDSGLNNAARRLRDADAVLLLGRKQDIILGYSMPPTVATDATLIQVDPSHEEIGRNRDVTVGILGDVATVIDQMTVEASKYSWTESAWTDELLSERNDQRISLEKLASDDVPMQAMNVHRVLGSFLRPDDCLVFDGGDYCHFGKAYLPARLKFRWFYVSPLGMLGAGLPTAMAVKLANPQRRVFFLTGDGGFGFNAMEYDTAVRHNLNIIGLLGNDAAWGIDRQIQMGVFGKTVATDLLSTRYDKVVSGLGGYGQQVKLPGELGPAIDNAIASDLPSLINVSVQRAISPRAEVAISRWRSRNIEPF